MLTNMNGTIAVESLPAAGAIVSRAIPEGVDENR